MSADRPTAASTVWNRQPAPTPSAASSPAKAEEPARHEVMSPSDRSVQAAWLKMVREVMSNTEDVGGKFAEEARRMHYGEVEERNIRGQATREETEALLEEGVPVLPLPVPKALKGTVQ